MENKIDYQWSSQSITMSLHPSVRCSLDGWIALFVYKHKLGTLEEIPRGTKANLIL